MNAPPPTPELCGSTSDSIAWTAIAASTALPPRFSTLSPASAASGLAAITNGESAKAAAATGCAAGAAMHEVKPRATTLISVRNRRMAKRLPRPVALAILSAKKSGDGPPARALRQSGRDVPDPRGREGRCAVPVGQARRRMELGQLARGRAPGGRAGGQFQTDRAPAGRSGRVGQREPPG